MLPARVSDPGFARAVQRDLVLWTTKDGREIPLDEMDDDHIANALRVLILWRSRVKKAGTDEAIRRELSDAIDRFKRVVRHRRKQAVRDDPRGRKKSSSFGPRRF